jgi:maleylacetate reductase
MPGIHQFPAMDRVVHGEPFAAALGREVERLDAHAVYVLASGTLARETDTLDQLRAALGNRLAGVWARIGAHTRRTDVVAAAKAARAAKADLLVTVGGGSVTDAAKMVGLCLGNDITEPAQLDRLRNRVEADGRTHRPPVQPPGVRSIAVPTTLSAGEFTASAGCTDTERHVKELFSHALMVPRVHPGSGDHPPHAGLAVPVHRHPRGGSRGRGYLLGGAAAVFGCHVAACAAPAVMRFAGRASRSG